MLFSLVDIKQTGKFSKKVYFQHLQMFIKLQFDSRWRIGGAGLPNFQPAITCSKLVIKTLEQDVKYLESMKCEV